MTITFPLSRIQGLGLISIRPLPQNYVLQVDVIYTTVQNIQYLGLQGTTLGWRGAGRVQRHPTGSVRKLLNSQGSMQEYDIYIYTYILGGQRVSHTPTSGPKYIRFGYMDLLGV